MGRRAQKSARPGKIPRALPRSRIWLCDWLASRERETTALFELDGRAGLLEFRFQFFALVAVDALFDRARRGVDDGLRLFQAGAGRVAHDFTGGALLAPGFGDPDVAGGGCFGPPALAAPTSGGGRRASRD